MKEEFLNTSDKVMEHFADDTCHIGGDYLFQLDPIEQDQVPFYVAEWCDEVIDNAREYIAGDWSQS